MRASARVEKDSAGFQGLVAAWCTMQGYDIMEEMYSPKSAASNFLHELCETRAKNLEPFMQQVCNSCTAH